MGGARAVGSVLSPRSRENGRPRSGQGRQMAERTAGPGAPGGDRRLRALPDDRGTRLPGGLVTGHPNRARAAGARRKGRGSRAADRPARCHRGGHARGGYHLAALRDSTFIHPQVIAGTVLCLNSDLAASVTGVTIPIDAGHLLLPYIHAPASLRCAG